MYFFTKKTNPETTKYVLFIHCLSGHICNVEEKQNSLTKKMNNLLLKLRFALALFMAFLITNPSALLAQINPGAYQWIIWDTSNSSLPTDCTAVINIDNNNFKWVSSQEDPTILPGSRYASYNNTSWGIESEERIGLISSPKWLSSDLLGNTWMAVSGGIEKFDGINWTYFNHTNSGFPETSPNVIERDASGDFWITTRDSGLVHFDGISWIYYHTGNSNIPHNEVTMLDIEPVSGDKWMLNPFGICHFDGATWTNYNLAGQGFPGWGMRDIVAISNTDVWVSTLSSGLLHFNGATWQQVNAGVPAGSLTSIDVAPNGDLWIGNSWNGLINYNGLAFSQYTTLNSGLPSDNVGQVEVQPNGDIWMATSDGIAKFDGVTTWTVYNKANSGLAANYATNIHLDPSGTPWCGQNQYLSALNGPTWDNYSIYTTSFFSNDFADIETDINNEQWMTGAYGLANFDGTSWTVYNNLNSPLPENGIDFVESDAAGNIWVAGRWPGFGLMKWDGASWTVYDTSNTNLPTQNTDGLEVSSDGKVWMINVFGLYYFNGATFVQVNAGPPASVMTMDTATGGGLWFGSQINGLFHFDGTNYTAYNSGNSPIPVGYITEVEPDANGGVWLTDAGTGIPNLLHFDGMSGWSYYHTGNSPMPNGWVRDIQVDQNGDLWAAVAGIGVLQLTPGLNINIGSDTVVCGQDSVQLSANYPGAQYNWSTGESTETIWATASGTYWVEVNDLTLGTSGSDTILVTLVPDPIDVDLGPDTAICGFGPLTLDAGFFPTAQYLWNIGATSQTININTSGLYTVAVLDQCGNTDIDSIIVTFGQFLSVSLGNDSNLCGNSLVLNAGTFPSVTYLWAPSGNTGQFETVTQSGTYIVTVSNGGCLATDTIDILLDTACVWPGDANYDNIANNVDVLSIGIAYGFFGPVRPNATTSWYAQPAADSPLFFPTGANYKHADCNGNGLVLQDDMNVITTNYGLTHLKTHTPATAGPGDPLLYFDAIQDSVAAGDTLLVHIALGTDTVPVDTAYGIALSLNYDPNLVDSSSVFSSFPVSWMGDPASTLLTFGMDLYQAGKIDLAIVRNDQQNTGGFGRICTIGFVMQDDIAGKTNVSQILDLFFSEVHLIRLDESAININLDTADVVVYKDGVWVDPLMEEIGIKVFPNPVNGDQQLLTIRSDQAKVAEVQLLNMLGQVVKSVKGPEERGIAGHTSTSNYSELKMDVSALPTGIYIAKISTDKGEMTTKVRID